jgi:hypothetical protein
MEFIHGILVFTPFTEEKSTNFQGNCTPFTTDAFMDEFLHNHSLTGEKGKKRD